MIDILYKINENVIIHSHIGIFSDLNEFTTTYIHDLVYVILSFMYYFRLYYSILLSF